MLKDAIDRIKIIAQDLEDDDPDKLEMLNIEGDYESLVNWALVKRNEYVSLAGSAKELSQTYFKRQKSFENSADRMKDIVVMIIEAAGETKYKGAAGTVSSKSVPPKPIVTDENLIPKTYFKSVLDKSLINEAVKSGVEIPGVQMDNGGMTWAIRK